MHYGKPRIRETNSLTLIEADVTFTPSGERKTVFVGVPKAFKSLISDRSDCFLPLFMCLALIHEDHLDLDEIEVDPDFLRNCSSAMRQLEAWNPKFKFLTPQNAEEQPAEYSDQVVTASFYSGGIDSLFTLVRHSQGRSKSPGSAVNDDVRYALHIFHNETVIEYEQIEREAQTLKSGAESLGVSFVPVISNIMTFDSLMHDYWSQLGHGAGLASVMHALGGEITHGLIGSTHTYGKLVKWGSSPITDPLLSSRALKIIHDGSTYSRVEKTGVVTSSNEAMNAINVCDNLIEGVGYQNCSQCQKCLRTMITIDLFGRAGNDACPSFKWDEYNPDKFGALYLHNDNELTFAEEIREAASLSRPDISQATERCIGRGRRMAPFARFESWIRNSEFGRKNRVRLKQIRDHLYKTLNIKR